MIEICKSYESYNSNICTKHNFLQINKNIPKNDKIDIKKKGRSNIKSMQVLFNRSILSILSDALNFARHWIRSKNPTIQNIDSRRFTDLIALDTSQFHFFLSFFFLLHCPMNTTRETFSIILSQSSMLERKEKGKHPE